jgi:SAM-dependent methyltransferase
MTVHLSSRQAELARHAPRPVVPTEDAPACPFCGVAGLPLHAALRDQHFGVPGEWGLLECERCRLAWLSPRPAPEEIWRVYSTYYTHGAPAPGAVFREHFSASGLAGTLRRIVLERLSRSRTAIRGRHLGYASEAGRFDELLGFIGGTIPVLRDVVLLSVGGLGAGERGRLLDVGCGNGRFLGEMRSLGWDVVGVEPDPQAAAVARENQGVPVVEGMLEDAAFEPASFDAVHLSHVVEHVYDPVSLLTECRRVLRPGGRLVLTTPNLDGLGHRVFGPAWRGLEPPRHLHLFTPASIAECARRAGFAEVAVRTSARLARGIWWDSRLAERAYHGRPAANSRWNYVESYLMYFASDLARATRVAAGDELVLTAAVPAGDVEAR